MLLLTNQIVGVVGVDAIASAGRRQYLDTFVNYLGRFLEGSSGQDALCTYLYTAFWTTLPVSEVHDGMLVVRYPSCDATRSRPLRS